MPPEAFIFDTSGQLVMQTAIGGPGTLFGPLLGAAVWLSLQDFLQGALGLGSAWKLVLGVVFVLLVCFLRHGLVGGIQDLYRLAIRSPAGRGRGARGGDTDPRRRRLDAGARARGRPHGRHDPRGQGPDQALRRPGRQQRHRLHRQGRRAARHHRPQRRGQEHLLQDADLRGPAERRHDRVRGPGHHRQGRDRGLPARPHQELPGEPAVHPAHGAPEPDDRRAGRPARPLPPRPVPQPGEDPGPERSRAAHARPGRPDGARRHGRSRRWPTARSAGSRSASRSRPRPACCCSTSRWPA